MQAFSGRFRVYRRVFRAHALGAYLVPCDGSEAQVSQILWESSIEFRMASVYEELNVFNLFLDRWLIDRLNGDFRSITAVNTVVTALKNCAELGFEVLKRPLFSGIQVSRRHSPKFCISRSELATLCLWV